MVDKRARRAGWHHGRQRIAILPAAGPRAMAYPSLGIVGARMTRLCRRYVAQHRRLPSPRRRARHAVPRDRRASRRLPRDRPASRGRRRVARIRGAGVPRLPDVRRAGARVRAPALHRLRARAAGAVLVQRPGLLSQLWRPAHDRVRRAPGRRGASAGARAPVGAERAVPAALFAGVGSRTRARGARRVRARVARLPARTCPPATESAMDDRDR